MNCFRETEAADGAVRINGVMSGSAQRQVRAARGRVLAVAGELGCAAVRAKVEGPGVADAL